MKTRVPGALARQPTESPVEHTVQKVPSETAPDGTKEEYERVLSMKPERLDEVRKSAEGA